jgi:hypothetical protein
MKGHRTVAAITVAVAAAAPLAAPPAVSADPAVPQADAPCAQNVGGALTQLLNYTTRVTTYLQCRAQAGGDYRWQLFDSPYPHSDRWLGYGPKLILHGEGQANREIDSGDWVAYPQDAASQCGAQQVVVVSAGKVGPPQMSTGEPGQPLKLRLLPLLFTIEMSGYCLWQKEQ